VRHPRQACHHHAQGHPTRSPHPWRACLSLFKLTLLKKNGLFQGQNIFLKLIFASHLWGLISYFKLSIDY
jgi:hypothetical protein